MLQKMTSAGWQLWRREENEFGFPRPGYFLHEPITFGLVPPTSTFSCCYDVAFFVEEQKYIGPTTDVKQKWVENKYDW